jgi:putative DNA primase/helicase
VRGRLESPLTNPEDRDNFTRPNILDHVKERRGELVMGGLAILAAYIRAGKPDMNLPAAGSFGGWSSLVRSAIVWAGQADPWATNHAARDDSDTEVEILSALFSAWDELFPGGEEGTITEARRRYNGTGGEYQRPEDRFPLTAEMIVGAGLKDFDAREIGKLLGRHKGRRGTGGRMIESRMGHNKVKKWRLKEAAV